MLTTIIFFLSFCLSASIKAQTTYNDFENIKISSRIKGLKLSILHLKNDKITKQIPVLFVHGSSFPSALSSGFRMNGSSWMDDLAGVGYDVYGLDFLDMDLQTDTRECIQQLLKALLLAGQKKYIWILTMLLST